ncbi:hypothetical protein HLB44_18610 [Aquincola sp. S2]|uniref:DNA-binding protein n=1 Tax=Pseudaquabacterium terrae TaxID=2732868 RepID=A0ABX2EKE8_9BURK|nr:hypothetical protein [Aquabacterium terrae]NRF69009.1 hypothetical protein [Aquabacterium terrae]
MSLKKTDMVKNLAKKLDGKMKSAGIPQRFAQGSSEVGAKRELRAGNTANKLVPVACRLPADLVNQLRDRAVGHEGGINALVARVLAEWLASSKGS